MKLLNPDRTTPPSVRNWGKGTVNGTKNTHLNFLKRIAENFKPTRWLKEDAPFTEGVDRLAKAANTDLYKPSYITTDQLVAARNESRKIQREGKNAIALYEKHAIAASDMDLKIQTANTKFKIADIGNHLKQYSNMVEVLDHSLAAEVEKADMNYEAEEDIKLARGTVQGMNLKANVYI